MRRLLFLGSNFSCTSHFRGDPYLNSTTVLFDNYRTTVLQSKFHYSQSHRQSVQIIKVFFLGIAGVKCVHTKVGPQISGDNYF